MSLLLLLMPQSHRFWPQEANEVLKNFTSQ
jgi:hypothetical protein